jgi:Ca2+-binding EF-hand superfamily protein
MQSDQGRDRAFHTGAGVAAAMRRAAAGWFASSRRHAMNRMGSSIAALVVATLPLAACGTGSLMSMGGFDRTDEVFTPQFKQIDTDGDGKISYADTRAWLARLVVENDANKDGKLQLKEIPPVLVPPKPDAQSFLLSYDRDGDGGLSADELGTYVNVLFQRDTNADGALTGDEVKHVPKNTPTEDAAGKKPASPSPSSAPGVPDSGR